MINKLNLQIVLFVLYIFSLIIFRKKLSKYTKKTKLAQKYPKSGMDIVIIILISGLLMHFMGLLFNWVVWSLVSVWLIAIGTSGMVPFGRGWKIPKNTGSVKEILIYIFSLFIPIFVLVFGMVFSEYLFGSSYLFKNVPRWYWLMESVLILSFGFIGFKIADGLCEKNN